MGIYLVLGTIFGCICAMMASGKERSAVGWFVIGFLLPLLGLILILVLDKPNDFNGGFVVPHDAPKLSQVEELERLATLHQQGSLTDAEFDSQKARILSHAT